MGFKVYMNEGEWDQICEWVLKHKDIETGGDLFGLWLDEHTAVVQFVLGPGKHCSRTTISFFQDVNYLYNAGTYLTTKQGLSNLGQWHSHHRIHLFEPSSGDKNTVWSNMPGLGLNRYIVFIANITNVVRIDCFLFQIKHGRQLPVKHGKFEFLSGNSPLRLNENILRNVYVGAESFNPMTTFEKEMKFLRNKNARDDHVPGYSARRVEHYFGDVSTMQEKRRNSYTCEHKGEHTAFESRIIEKKSFPKSEQKRGNYDGYTKTDHYEEDERSQLKRNTPIRRLKDANIGQDFHHHTRTSVGSSKVTNNPDEKVFQKQPGRAWKSKGSEETKPKLSSVLYKPDGKGEVMFLRGDYPTENNRYSPPPGHGNRNRREIHTSQFDYQQNAVTSSSRNIIQNREVYTQSEPKGNRINQFPGSSLYRNDSNPSTLGYISGELVDKEPRGRKGHRKDYYSSRQRDYNQETIQTSDQYRRTPQRSRERVPKENDQAIVRQPESFSSGLESTRRKRKSGDYDNVPELFQPKSSKPNPYESNSVSYYNQDKRPSTPSGTFPHKEDQRGTFHHNEDQRGTFHHNEDQRGTFSHKEDHRGTFHHNENEITGGNCLTRRCHPVEILCSMMRCLTITEQDSTDVNKGRQDEKDKEQDVVQVTIV